MMEMKSFCEGCRHLFRPSTRGRWKLVLSKANFFTQCNQRICPRPIWSLLAGSVGHFETTSSVCLDYKDILRLNTLVQLFLMLWIAHLLSCHSLTHLLFPLALMFCSLTPIATGICLQYTPCFLIMAIGCVVLLRHTNIINKFNWLFFLSLGMATSYFDFWHIRLLP